MTNQDFRTPIVEYIRAQAKPVEKFSHQERLYALTPEVGAGQLYDDDVVFAAAWLHDLGVFVGHRPAEIAALAKWDHVAYVVGRAPSLLRGFGFPEGKISSVVEAIRGHLPTSQPGTIEAIILRDADLLEQLGAVGILRNVCKIGRDTRFHTFPDVLRLLQKNLDTLPAQLRLPTSQRLAAPRIQALQAFLHAARAEGCDSKG